MSFDINSYVTSYIYSLLNSSESYKLINNSLNNSLRSGANTNCPSVIGPINITSNDKCLIENKNYCYTDEQIAINKIIVSFVTTFQSISSAEKLILHFYINYLLCIKKFFLKVITQLKNFCFFFKAF